MLPDLTKRFINNWDKFLPGISKPDNIKYLCIAGSAEGGSTAYLAFSNKRREPLFAVKITRYCDSEERVFNEKNILSFFADCDNNISNSVPKLILCEKISGCWAIAQSIMIGQPMRAKMSRKGTPELLHTKQNFDLATSCLKDLFLSTRNLDSSVLNNLKKNISLLIKEFARVFELSTEEKNSLNLISSNIDNILKYGACIQHGDYCRQNLLVEKSKTNNQISVIDWTDSSNAGFPLHDMFYFFTSYFMQVRTGKGYENILQAFLNTFFSPNPYCNLVKKNIIDHCKDISIEQKDLSVLFGLFLVKQSMFEYKKMLKCAKHDTLPRFTINLAKRNGSNFIEAPKQQLWIHFFKECVKKQIFVSGNFL